MDCLPVDGLSHLWLLTYPHPPPIYFIPDIVRVEKTITKTSSVSCVTELVIKLSYNYSTYAVNLASLQLNINEQSGLNI